MAKLFDSELKLMELIWEHEPIEAKKLSLIATEALGWNKNTTYTVVKKMIEKGYLNRTEPGFVVTSEIGRSDIQQSEIARVVDRLFQGSKKAFFASFLESQELQDDEIKELRRMIEKKK